MRKKTLPGTTSISQGLAQTLQDVGLEASLEAFEKAFPDANLTVEVEPAELSITHYLRGAEAGEDFLVTALTYRGERTDGLLVSLKTVEE